MGRRVRLRVHSDVAHLLSQGARVQLGDEATLLLLSDAHVTDGSNINHTIVGAAHVVEKATNGWGILITFSLGCIHRHRSKNLSFLVLSRLLRRMTILRAYRTTIVWANILRHQVILITG